MRPVARARTLVPVLVGLAIAGCRMRPPCAQPFTTGGLLRPVADASPVAVPAPSPIARAAAVAALPASPSAVPAPPAAPSAARAAAMPVVPEPRTLREVLDRLRRDARSGADPELSAHAELLDSVAGALPPAANEVALLRMPGLEAAGVARHRGRLGFATLTSYVERGGDAEALRRVYLDYDRIPEFTGKPGTRTLAREPGAVLGRTDAMRRTLGIEYGARWTFRSRPVDRGSARLIVSSMVEAADSAHMIFTQGIWIGLPEGDGVRVVEAALSVMDFEVPGILKGIAEQTARKELLTRTEGMRRHWRQYVR